MLTRASFLSLALAVGVCALAEERVALVIGNGAYDGDAALRNATNDADSIAATLKNLNFKVTKKTDLDLAQFERTVVDFHRSLSKGCVALFFYAGHGVQVKGENFLVPLRARPEEEFQVKEKCYKVDQVLSAMDDSKAALKIVILDCCRDNPFTRSWRNRGDSSKGLASITDVPEGTIIAFSTAPGKTALDGRGANSPYTSHLVANLELRPEGGLEITEALREASRAVKRSTGQIPWLNLEASLDKYYLWKTGDKSPVEKPAQAVSILDIRDLTKHWETKGNWAVKDGVATLTPRAGESGYLRLDHYLWSHKKYGDFEIEFEYAIQKDGNSGFFFRCEDKADPVARGIEVQIRDSEGPVDPNKRNLDNGGVYSGGVPGVQPIKNAAKAGFVWNKYVITVRRDQLTVVLNGSTVNSVDLSQGAFANRPRRGYIGFQDNATPVWLQKMTIREFE